jgi:hypothetical protein
MGTSDAWPMSHHAACAGNGARRITSCPRQAASIGLHVCTASRHGAKPIYVASPSSSLTTIYANNSATCTASSPSSPIKVFVNANGFCVATLLHVDE